jgi:hypothetical protein
VIFQVRVKPCNFQNVKNIDNGQQPQREATLILVLEHQDQLINEISKLNPSYSLAIPTSHRCYAKCEQLGSSIACPMHAHFIQQNFIQIHMAMPYQGTI